MRNKRLIKFLFLANEYLYNFTSKHTVHQNIRVSYEHAVHTITVHIYMITVQYTVQCTIYYIL